MSRQVHVTGQELELYVMGALDAARVDAFESHCATCEACAEALAGEAELEVAFEQVARAPVAAKTRVAAALPVRAAAYGAAGIFAMAAAVLVWFGHGPTPSAASAAGEGSGPALHHAMDDGAILDARNDALDGG